MESMESRWRGDKGDQGEQGDQGERGQTGAARLPVRQAQAIVWLFGIAVLFAVFSLFIVTHEIARNNQKFCAVVTGLTIPVPKPANPASNPSREHQYIGYLKVVKLGHDLGCR